VSYIYSTLNQKSLSNGSPDFAVAWVSITELLGEPFQSLLPDEKKLPQRTAAPEDNRSASERLNELGEEGWELVSVAQHIEDGEKRRAVYWLKP
jgi:hypothetical protein